MSDGIEFDWEGRVLLGPAVVPGRRELLCPTLVPIALRKFTSSELLDAGFNISMVAQRQGHGPQVLAKHYAKRRRSADRKAAEHLGRVVHGAPPS